MLASLSLDLDNQWSYMKTHGDAGWEDFPSYLDTVVPRILDFLRERDLRITFFIVGQDASLEKNRSAIASIAAAGHEIANHSFGHEPWLHLYSKQQIVEEFEKTEDALEKITGKRPVGFRGPGFSLSPEVLEVLGERGYEYDCSLLPTYIAPLARAYYFLRSPNISRDERERLKKMFGKFSDGSRSLKPHVINCGDKELIEIPVSTFPGVKTPVHASYLIYLATFAPSMAKAYWKAAIAASRAAGVGPSFLLHPLDFLDQNDVPNLKFHPGMSLPVRQKIDLLGFVIDSLAKHFTIVGTGEHARHARQQLQSAVGGLRLKKA